MSTPLLETENLSIAFLIILGVLFVRPQGLFGKKNVERV